jgi:hypothetical protein
VPPPGRQICSKDGLAAPAPLAKEENSHMIERNASPVVPTPPKAADRWNRGAWLLRDDTLSRLEILLDEAFPIPGTHIRFGIDGIIGLIPGLGDVLAGLLSLIIPLAAWVRGLPYITLARMAANLAIGVLVGTIPIFGDIFDIAWKANRRNYRLLRRHLGEPRRHTWRDWAFLIMLCFGLAAVFALPIALVAWAVAWLINR